MALTVLLIMYPGICTRIFQVLKCKGIDGIDNEVLQADFSIMCSNGDSSLPDERPLGVVYLFMIICKLFCCCISFVAFILLHSLIINDTNNVVDYMIFVITDVVGLPVGIFALLKCNRKDLYDVSSPRHEEVNVEYGTLYNQYEEKFW